MAAGTIMLERQFTVIGPVHSGKTTYFAALYYLLKNSDTQYRFRLNLQHEIQDRSYLNEISQKWADLEEIEHTVTDFWGKLELPLLHRDNGKQLVVFIPDLAGESFQGTLETRSWEEKFANQLRQSDGIMLFINVLDYRDIVALTGKLASASDAKKDKVESEESQIVPWQADIQKLPSDVVYTDLIQQVFYDNQNQHYRLSIILSAWDSIKTSPTKKWQGFYEHPERYFRERFPLMSQFLDSQSNTFQVKVFGVSAYGCDPTQSEEREKLEDVEPFERVQVVDADGSNHDITLPLMHLLNNE